MSRLKSSSIDKFLWLIQRDVNKVAAYEQAIPHTRIGLCRYAIWNATGVALSYRKTIQYLNEEFGENWKEEEDEYEFREVNDAIQWGSIPEPGRADV